MSRPSKSGIDGLCDRNGIWHINKTLPTGERLRESTGESDLAQAIVIMQQRVRDKLRPQHLQEIPVYRFEDAAARFLEEALTRKKTADRDRISLDKLVEFMGDWPLTKIHEGSIQPFIQERRKNVTPQTINRDLSILRVVLKHAATLWRDASGKPWLAAPPLIRALPCRLRQPTPLSWAQYLTLMARLPAHLAPPMQFAFQTGCRQEEICGLKWEWEDKERGAFIIPAEVVKGRIGRTVSRLVPLNSLARQVIEGQRGIHKEYVFPYEGHRMLRLSGTAFNAARRDVGLSAFRVHDARHTFGRWLRAAGVSDEDRADLLGHQAGRITTHYSKAEIERLREAAEHACSPPR